MLTRTLATTILSASLLTACALDGDDTDQPEAPALDGARVNLPADLEATVFAALHADTSNVRLMRSDVDALGKTHVRALQHVRNVPVFEAEAIVHVAADGTTEVTDKREPDLDVDTVPTLTADRAIDIAASAHADCVPADAPALWIVRGDRPHLAWRVELAGAAVAPIVFVDAHDGSIVRQWDNVQHITGDTLYNGTQTIPAYYFNGRYYLEDNEFNLEVGDFNYGTDPDNDPWSRVYSADTNVEEQDAAQAMFSLRNAAQYFYAVHGRWNPDGNGGPGKKMSIDGSRPKRVTALIDSRFWYRDGSGTYGANAAWWKNTLLLGMGDTSTKDWMSLDVVGHEFTHGVVQYTAGLTYMNESGALNESFADVFGAMAERYRLGESNTTWQLSEKEHAGVPLRWMDEPTYDGNSRDYYADRLITDDDNGGVHYNSGIGNKAFYLVAKGGTHNHGGYMAAGIGADRAAKIWYLALSYMTSGSTFIDARSATQNAARDLYGYQSPEWNAVSNAWAMCGVGIVSNDTFVNGNFELDTGWTYTGRAFATTGYAQSGLRNLQLGGAINLAGSAEQVFSLDPLATTATLSFYVNVSTTDTSLLAADVMTADIIDADTGAVLVRAGTWSNRSGSTAGSYTNTTVNMIGLRGRTLRIKFNSTNNSTGATTFRVDNVQVIATR